MPKAKAPLTEVELLRKYAGHATGTRYEDAIDAVSNLEERKDAAETATEALADLDDARDAVQAVADALVTLAEHGLADQAKANKLTEAADMITEVIDNLDAEALRTFVEAYEGAHDALEEYSNLKEDDPYPGKRDDLEEHWQEATDAMDGLAEALETLEG